jgi:hypothetical protein
MTPDIPESAVRLEAAGPGLEFVLHRHAYLVLDAAARSEVFPGRAPLAERRATAVGVKVAPGPIDVSLPQGRDVAACAGRQPDGRAGAVDGQPGTRRTCRHTSWAASFRAPG